MARLNAEARQELAYVGISMAKWARRAGWADGKWRGDECGCPDDRCIGYHHDERDECGCLGVLIRSRTGIDSIDSMLGLPV